MTEVNGFAKQPKAAPQTEQKSSLFGSIFRNKSKDMVASPPIDPIATAREVLEKMHPPESPLAIKISDNLMNIAIANKTDAPSQVVAPPTADESTAQHVEGLFAKERAEEHTATIVEALMKREKEEGMPTIDGTTSNESSQSTATEQLPTHPPESGFPAPFTGEDVLTQDARVASDTVLRELATQEVSEQNPPSVTPTIDEPKVVLESPTPVISTSNGENSSPHEADAVTAPLQENLPGIASEVAVQEAIDRYVGPEMSLRGLIKDMKKKEVLEKPRLVSDALLAKFHAVIQQKDKNILPSTTLLTKSDTDQSESVAPVAPNVEKIHWMQTPQERLGGEQLPLTGQEEPVYRKRRFRLEQGIGLTGKKIRAFIAAAVATVSLTGLIVDRMSPSVATFDSTQSGQSNETATKIPTISSGLIKNLSVPETFPTQTPIEQKPTSIPSVSPTEATSVTAQIPTSVEQPREEIPLQLIPVNDIGAVTKTIDDTLGTVSTDVQNQTNLLSETSKVVTNAAVNTVLDETIEDITAVKQKVNKTTKPNFWGKLFRNRSSQPKTPQTSPKQETSPTNVTSESIVKIIPDNNDIVSKDSESSVQELMEKKLVVQPGSDVFTTIKNAIIDAGQGNKWKGQADAVAAMAVDLANLQPKKIDYSKVPAGYPIQLDQFVGTATNKSILDASLKAGNRGEYQIPLRQYLAEKDNN